MSMISRGWIFPDGTEYSLAGFQVHGHTISNYFRYLRNTDEKFYEKLLDDMDEYRCTVNPERYVINRLGWILVGKRERMIIQCAGFSFQNDYLIPYEEAGWTIDNEYLPERLFWKVDWKPPF